MVESVFPFVLSFWRVAFGSLTTFRFVIRSAVVEGIQSTDGVFSAIFLRPFSSDFLIIFLFPGRELSGAVPRFPRVVASRLLKSRLKTIRRVFLP